MMFCQQLQAADERRVTSVQLAIEQLADVEKQSLSIVTTCIDGLQQAASIVQCQQVTACRCSVQFIDQRFSVFWTLPLASF